MKKVTILVILILTVLTFSFSHLKEEKLIVKGGEPILYKSESGELITVKFYFISDNSLYFVKVTLPNSYEVTLPLVVSASGERYTDNHNYAWWVKGDTAIIEKRNNEGDWEILYKNCKQLSQVE